MGRGKNCMRVGVSQDNAQSTGHECASIDFHTNIISIHTLSELDSTPNKFSCILTIYSNGPSSELFCD